MEIEARARSSPEPSGELRKRDYPLRGPWTSKHGLRNGCKVRSTWQRCAVAT